MALLIIGLAVLAAFSPVEPFKFSLKQPTGVDENQQPSGSQQLKPQLDSNSFRFQQEQLQSYRQEPGLEDQQQQMSSSLNSFKSDILRQKQQLLDRFIQPSPYYPIQSGGTPALAYVFIRPLHIPQLAQTQYQEQSRYNNWLLPQQQYLQPLRQPIQQETFGYQSGSIKGAAAESIRENNDQPLLEPQDEESGEQQGEQQQGQASKGHSGKLSKLKNSIDRLAASAKAKLSFGSYSVVSEELLPPQKPTITGPTQQQQDDIRLIQQQSEERARDASAEQLPLQQHLNIQQQSLSIAQPQQSQLNLEQQTILEQQPLQQKLEQQEKTIVKQTADDSSLLSSSSEGFDRRQQTRLSSSYFVNPTAQQQQTQAQTAIIPDRTPAKQ